MGRDLALLQGRQLMTRVEWADAEAQRITWRIFIRE